MRKDVECTFGILKKQFSILQTGIRLGRIEHCDKAWRTCCALHNLLLFHDGLDKNWGFGTNMNEKRLSVNNIIPFAIDRLNSNQQTTNNSNHAVYEKDYFKNTL